VTPNSFLGAGDAETHSIEIFVSFVKMRRDIVLLCAESYDEMVTSKVVLYHDLKVINFVAETIYALRVWSFLED